MCGKQPETIKGPFWTRIVQKLLTTPVLGPLLFLVYINDTNQCLLSDHCFLSLYADDMLLYKILKNTDAISEMQSDVNTLSHWVSDNHLSFNSAKCKFMLLSWQSNHNTCSLDLTDAIEKEVDEMRYLGVIISCDLS